MALAALAVVLWAGPAAAQNDVTFQVNIKPYITSCQFKPATEKVVVRGTINDWAGDAFALADPDGDGTYTGTFPLAAGAIAYKFVSTGALSFEDQTPNREYTVVAGAQTIPVVDFADGPPVSACASTEKPYDLFFSVDMSVARARGSFKPATDRVGVLGEIQGWDETNPFLLQQDALTGEYSAIVPRTVLSPSSTGFKFVIQRPRADGTFQTFYESVDNRSLTLTGNETTTGGRLQYTYDTDGNPATKVFFNNVDRSGVLSGPATVTFNVDLRSARYATAAGVVLNGGATSATSVWINGPLPFESTQEGGPGDDSIKDWADWGAPLRAINTRKLSAAATGDGIYSITLNFGEGASRLLKAKFGVNGDDNESASGGDHYFPIKEGAQTFNVAFGCVRQENGRFTDETGDKGAFNTFDEYLLIRNDLNPPTCVTVPSGGKAGDINNPVAVENGPEIAGLEISAAYPNPLRSTGRIDLTLDRAMSVSARVYDVTGRQVATLLDGRDVAAGRTTVDLDVSRLATGVYVLRIEAGGQVASRRMTITR